MKRCFWLAFVLCMVLSAPAFLAAGDIYPGGPYGTKITSLPYTISAPGAYYLAGNLTYSSDAGDAITINSDDVTLDLMGFTLSYNGTAVGRSAIFMDGRTNVEVRNGTLSGWRCGIYEANSIGSLHRIINIRTQGLEFGISLFGNGHSIQGCSSLGGTDGLVIVGTGIIKGCIVKQPSTSIGIGVDNGIITGNMVDTVSDAEGVTANQGALIMGNELINCSPEGISCHEAAVIGNTVSTSSADQTGIRIEALPALLDQNTVTGTGVHYSIPSGVQTRNNAG